MPPELPPVRRDGSTYRIAPPARYGRSLEDFNHERQALDAAHSQNEAQRDAFVALAHTALFAASISFVGSVAPIGHAIWKPALILGWTSDVLGLLALTFSFGAARRAIDARREALNDDNPPKSVWADRLNAIALWSFPASLLFLFSFVTANVVHTDDRKTDPPTAAHANFCDGRCISALSRPDVHNAGGVSPASGTNTSRAIQP